MGSDCLLRWQTGQPGALCGPVYLSTVLPINPCLPVWCAKRATEYVSVSFNYPPTTANQLNISLPGCTVLKRSSIYIWECHSDCRLLSDAPFIIPFTSVGFACPLPSWVSHTTSRKYHIAVDWTVNGDFVCIESCQLLFVLSRQVSQCPRIIR